MLGALLIPWQNNHYPVQGIDITPQGFYPTLKKNYLAIKKGSLETPKLVIMNPPFNLDKTTKTYVKKKYGGRPLLPELWLRKAVELFGKQIPIVMFTSYGFRLNQTLTSKRWKKLTSGDYPPITSIISLPKNIFTNVIFHSEVLIFNLPQLKGHYFFRSP